jgi:predicted ATPase
MSGLSLALFGSFRADFNGLPLAHFRTRTVQALLIYLTCQPEAHNREHLIALLWPGMPEGSAKKNLRQSLYLLRQAIPEIEAKNGVGCVTFLLADRQTVQVNPDGRYELDCQTFSELLSHDETGWPDAVARYRGDFLADFYLPHSAPFEEWVHARRGYWRRQVLWALETLTERELSGGDLKTAEQYARQQIEIDNLREQAHQQLMTVLTRDGRRIDALNHYETFVQMLHTELAVEPSAETQALYEAIRSGDLDKLTSKQEKAVVGAPASPHPVSDTLPNNLSRQPTPLVGREADLDALDKLLTNPDMRLVSIVGPGGMGKTRLAIACAEHCVGAGRVYSDLFANGVFFVNLAPLSDVDQIIPALALTLQLSFQSNDPRSARQQVLDYLSQKRMLLVMDNLEHLLDGINLLLEIAQTAPGVRMLVTSRDRLHLQLEQVYPLQGLSFPEATTAAAPEAAADALTYTAVQLFQQCARRSQPDFNLQSAEDLADAARICRQVAGMPLAIELAAAWVDTLSLPDIAAEIQQSLDFLETVRRDMPERHRSVRAAINTSWDRLAEREQTTLVQISVFRGGFTREAVQAVAGASVATLSRLVIKSFLQYDRVNNRYQIHELLRQYAAEKLALEPDEEAALRDRHSATYCAFLHEHSENWHTGQQLATLAAVSADAENARLALDWAVAEGNWQRLAQAIDSWAWFLNWQGRDLDGKSFYQAIIDKAEAQDAVEAAVPPDCLRVWVKARTWLDWFVEDYRNISDNTEQSLALLKRPQLAGQDTRREKAFVRWQKAIMLVVLAPDEARSLYEHVLTEYQALGDQWGIAECMFGLGRLDFDTGHFTSSLQRMQSVERIYRERGDRRRQADILSMLGFVHMDLGHLDEAERLHRKALSRSLEISYKAGLGWRKAALARTVLWGGRVEEANQLASESLVSVHEQGATRSEEATARLTVGGVQVYAGHYVQAQQELARVSRFVEIVGNVAREAWLFHLQGLLAVIESSYVEAQSAFSSGLRIWHSTYPHHFVPPLTALGLATFRLGKIPPAQHHLAKTLTKALAHESIAPALATLPVVALMLAASGDAIQAVEIWALAKGHPFVANSRWFEDAAGRELEELAASLPPDVAAAADARGREMDLWKTVERLLTELR